MPKRKTQRRKSHAVSRHHRKINGRGLFSWLGKAGSWLAKNILPMAKTAGKTAFKMYQDPNVRAVADQYAGPQTKKYMGKADDLIKFGNSMMGKGRKRRTVRMRQKKSLHRGGSLGGSLGNGLGMYGRGRH
jgi:hypothetical protein